MLTRSTNLFITFGLIFFTLCLFAYMYIPPWWIGFICGTMANAFYILAIGNPIKKICSYFYSKSIFYLSMFTFLVAGTILICDGIQENKVFSIFSGFLIFGLQIVVLVFALKKDRCYV